MRLSRCPTVASVRPACLTCASVCYTPVRGIPSPSQECVQVNFGKPLDLQDLTCNCNKVGVDQPKVWRSITDRVRDALLELEQQSASNTDQTEYGRAPHRHESGHDRTTVF